MVFPAPEFEPSSGGILSHDKTMLTALAMAITVSLTGSNWVSPANAAQTLTFEGSRISGTAGCNRFMGSFTQDGDNIVLGDIASTRKACAPDIMVKEQKWLTMLDKVRQVEISGDELLLKDATGKVIGKLARAKRG
jgi:heat shock protein HslJ